MGYLAIRCHLTASGADEEVHRWLEQQVERLGSAMRPDGAVELSRLTSERCPTEFDARAAEPGWLLELTRTGDEQCPLDGPLVEVLADMRLLGLRPMVLASVDSTVGDDHDGRARPRDDRSTHPADR